MRTKLTLNMFRDMAGGFSYEAQDALWRFYEDQARRTGEGDNYYFDPDDLYHWDEYEDFETLYVQYVDEVEYFAEDFVEEYGYEDNLEFDEEGYLTTESEQEIISHYEFQEEFVRRLNRTGKIWVVEFDGAYKPSCNDVETGYLVFQEY